MNTPTPNGPIRQALLDLVAKAREWWMTTAAALTAVIAAAYEAFTGDLSDLVKAIAAAISPGAGG